MLIYGDFTDLLSLVASMRADTLIDEGLDIEWRAVVSEPTTTVASLPRRDALSREVSGLAPAGLRAPGFMPSAKAPVAAYAEAVGAGIGDHVRYLLFTAYWREHEDIGNPDVLRRLLTVPMLRSGSSTDVVREYGYAVSISGAPVTSDAWRRMRGWEAAWRGLDNAELPVVVDGADYHCGHDAIRHLGTLGEGAHTFAASNPYSLPPMPLPARRPDLARPGRRPTWRDVPS